MIKYYILPGYVRSKYDSDLHYINADSLIRLYNVDKRECVILVPNTRYTEQLIERASDKGIKILEPRYNGDYSV